MADEIKSLKDKQVEDERTEEEKAERELARMINADAQEEQGSMSVLAIAGYISSCWEAARSAKETIQDELYASFLQRKGRYSAAKLKEIKGQPAVFMNLTAVKCRAAEAWIREILSSSEQIWTIRPTSLPDLSPAEDQVIAQGAAQRVMEQGAASLIKDEKELMDFVRSEVRMAKEGAAYETAARMERKIRDQLTEAKWRGAIAQVLSDIVTYKAGFLKGPVVRRKSKLYWEEGMDGVFKPSQGKQLTVEYERVSPFDIYPSPEATSIENGYIIEYHKLTRKNLEQMIGVTGYSESSIRLILDQYSRGGLRSWAWAEDQRRRDEMESAGDTDRAKSPDGYIDALEFWGEVNGKMLAEWGLKVPDKNLEYQVNAWLVGSYVIKAVINPSPTGEKPYYKASYEEIPGSFWGRGIPELMEIDQDICNACARSLVRNMGMSSGPQAVIDVAKLASNERLNEMHPFKIWYVDTSDSMPGGGKPIEFFTPESNAAELLAIYKYFDDEAEKTTGIPRHSYGASDIGGAGRALADYEKVVTPDGMVEIGSMKVGDKVCNTYGSTSSVVGVFPQGESDIFRVKFNNGEHVDCDMDHRWSVKRLYDETFRTLTTEEILDKGLFYKDKNCHAGWRSKWQVPMTGCVEFAPREVKIDPYTMGALLGDGDAECVLTGMDDGVFDRIPYPLGKIRLVKNSKAYQRAVKGIRADYHSYGLNCRGLCKFIPEDYLFNTREVRLELLRGLMDTDGYCTKKGQTIFSSSSYQLILGVKQLVKSLGGTIKSIYTRKARGECEIMGRKCFVRESYMMSFILPKEKVFHLKRKELRVTVKPKRYTHIVGIEYIGKHNATCITVDSDNSLFVCENFIPTHNTASGMAMLMANASRGVKFVLSGIDSNIIAPSVREIYIFNMLFDPDESIKGDLEVVARGMSSIMESEQTTLRMIEFMNMLSNNEVYLSIVGMEGIAKLLRKSIKSLNIVPDDIVPSDEKIAMQQQQRMQQQQAEAAALAAQTNPTPGKNPATLQADGSRAGGVDSSLFVQQPQGGEE